MPTGRPATILPGGAQVPSARGMSQLTFQRQQKQLQDSFKSQWDAITTRSRKLGDRQTGALLNRLQKQAGMEAQKLTKIYSDQQMYLDQIKSLSDSGLISNGDELMWKAVVGADAAKAMRPPRSQSTMELFTAQEREGRVIEREMGPYRETGGGSPGILGFWASPIDSIRGFGKSRPAVTQVWNPDKGKEGGWDTATASQDQYYKELKKMQTENQSLKQLLLSGGRMSRNAAKMALRPNNHSSLQEKVLSTQTLSKPPEPQPKQHTPSRKQLLAEYKRLGGSKTEAGTEFANRYLR